MTHRQDTSPTRAKTGDAPTSSVPARSDIGEGMLKDGWWYPDFPAVLDVARTIKWGRRDLFPRFGMPTLRRRHP